MKRLARALPHAVPLPEVEIVGDYAARWQILPDRAPRHCQSVLSRYKMPLTISRASTVRLRPPLFLSTLMQGTEMQGAVNRWLDTGEGRE